MLCLRFLSSRSGPDPPHPAPPRGPRGISGLPALSAPLLGETQRPRIQWDSPPREGEAPSPGTDTPTSSETPQTQTVEKSLASGRRRTENTEPLSRKYSAPPLTLIPRLATETPRFQTATTRPETPRPVTPLQVTGIPEETQRSTLPETPRGEKETPPQEAETLLAQTETHPAGGWKRHRGTR